MEKKKKAEMKRHRVETFLDEGVRQNPDRYSIVAIEIEPGEIEYAAEMVQVSSTSFKKGRDNIRCPLNNDLTLSIDPNSSYVRVNWLKEVPVQQEVDENNGQMLGKKRFKFAK
jgi:hypothetical protein